MLYSPSVIPSKFLVRNQRRMCVTLWLQSVVMIRHATCPLGQFCIYLCINLSASVVSSSDQSHLTLSGPYTVYHRDVSRTVSFFSVYTATRWKKPQTPTLTTLCLITNLQPTLPVNTNPQHIL